VARESVHRDRLVVSRPIGKEDVVTAFVARSAEFDGRLPVSAPVEKAFELFSPLGERSWVPKWDPELLHPPGVSWAVGQIFRTGEEKGEAVWIVTALDRKAHRVEYHRVEPGRYVARIRVACSASGEGKTEVATAYAFVGLSEEGNAEIEAMTDAFYAEKMGRWERWIAAHLGPRTRAE
jgi:hypothetical protein